MTLTNREKTLFLDALAPWKKGNLDGPIYMVQFSIGRLPSGKTWAVYARAFFLTCVETSSLEDDVTGWVICSKHRSREKAEQVAQDARDLWGMDLGKEKVARLWKQRSTRYHGEFIDTLDDMEKDAVELTLDLFPAFRTYRMMMVGRYDGFIHPMNDGGNLHTLTVSGISGMTQGELEELEQMTQDSGGTIDKYPGAQDEWEILLPVPPVGPGKEEEEEEEEVQAVTRKRDQRLKRSLEPRQKDILMNVWKRATFCHCEISVKSGLGGDGQFWGLVVEWEDDTRPDEVMWKSRHPQLIKRYAILAEALWNEWDSVALDVLAEKCEQEYSHHLVLVKKMGNCPCKNCGKELTLGDLEVGVLFQHNHFIIGRCQTCRNLAWPDYARKKKKLIQLHGNTWGEIRKMLVKSPDTSHKGWKKWNFKTERKGR